MKTKDEYFDEIVKYMKELGTYKPQFNMAIEVLATCYLQYQLYYRQWLESGCVIVEEHTNKAGATNMRKTPIYAALETLRKDIAQYTTLLKLNPKSADVSLKKEKDKSIMSAIVLGGDIS